MGCTLSRFTLGLSEESALSELPFFCEDSVENSCLPPRPPSVCEECWEGPFAMHFGIPLVSLRSGKWYRRWPEEISYSTSLTKLESRADAGCAWCRLIYRLAQYWHAGHHHETTGLMITLRGTADQDSAQGQMLQKLIVEISPGRVRTDFFFYTDRGVLGAFKRNVKTKLIPYIIRGPRSTLHQNTKPHPGRWLPSCAGFCKTTPRRVSPTTRAVLQKLH